MRAARGPGAVMEFTPLVRLRGIPPRADALTRARRERRKVDHSRRDNGERNSCGS